MTKVAVFNTEPDAIAYSNKVHQYLTANRPGYNAVKWADPEQSADGLTWMVKLPIEKIEQKWSTPINTAAEKAKAEGITEDFPDVGGLVEIGKYYLYKGDVLKCRQTHNRTIYEPKDTPALFSFFRDNSEQLQWMAGEQVEVGWQRIHNNVRYEVILAHQTQDDWTPDKTPTLWKEVITIPVTVEWAVGVAYKVGQDVTYKGASYSCLQDHTSIDGWFPNVVPALWQKK